MLSRIAITLLAVLFFVPTLHAQSPAKPRTDFYGDPLPEGAIARLGTTRFRHGEAVDFAAFSSDGKSAISVDEDGIIRVCEFPSGKEIRRFGEPRGLLHYVEPVAMTGDGRIVATCFDGQEVRFYEVETGRSIATLKLPTRLSGGLAFSPDGKNLATIDLMSAIRVYDWSSGKNLLTINGPPNFDELARPFLAYSSDGKTLVASYSQETYAIRVYNSTNGKMLREISVSATVDASFRATIVSPDGKKLAVPVRFSAKKKEPRLDTLIIDTATGKEICKLFIGYGTAVFSQDGTKLYTRGQTQNGGRVEVHEVDAASGNQLRSFGEAMPKRKPSGDGGGGLPPRLAMSRQGDVLVCYGGDQALQFFDVKTGREIAEFAVHFTPPLSVRFAEQGKEIITQSADLLPHRWDAASGKYLGIIDTQKLPEFYSAPILSPNGQVFSAQMFAFFQGKAGFFDVASGKELASFPIPEKDSHSYGNTVFSPNSKVAAIRWEGASQIELREVPTGNLQRRIEVGTPEKGKRLGRDPERDMPETLLFSCDGSILMSYAMPNFLGFWNVSTGKRLGELPLKPGERIRHAAFSPDGRTLALEMNYGSVKLFEFATKQLRHYFGPTKANSAKDPDPYSLVNVYTPFGHQLGSRVAFSPDGKLLAHAGIDRVVHLWNTDNGREVATMKGHQGPLCTIAFSPDGRLLASGSADTTVLIWDVWGR